MMCSLSHYLVLTCRKTPINHDVQSGRLLCIKGRVWYSHIGISVLFNCGEDGRPITAK